MEEESSVMLPPSRDRILSQQWQELLYYDDVDFCGTSVATDFADKSYLHALSLVLSSPAVLHAIFGFSSHYRGRGVLHHKSESMIHFPPILGNSELCAESPVPLTTLILLISLRREVGGMVESREKEKGTSK